MGADQPRKLILFPRVELNLGDSVIDPSSNPFVFLVKMIEHSLSIFE